MAIQFGLPMLGIGLGLGVASQLGNWGSNFGGCCNRLLGPQRGGLTGALLGGLIGGICGGPIGGLLGAGIGGLLGQAFGNRHACSHHHPCHQQASCYPPPPGGCFGGPQYGGYGCPPSFGSQYGGYGGGGFPGAGYQGFGFDQGFNGFPQFPGGGYQQFGFGGYNGTPQAPGGWGQQWGGGNGCWSPGQNFNFGHCCPQQQCCPGQRPPDGRLSQEGGPGKPIEYKTSGGYTIKVNGHTITVTDPNGKNEVKHWGDPHINLNGKHLKDWNDKQHTMILGDGTKITMTAQGPQGITESMSIYDGRQNVQINNNKNEITHRSFNPWDTMRREQDQYDGETSIFRTNNRTGVASYSNLYTQDSAFNVNWGYQQIGRTGGYRNPNQVHDFYDDPRIGHT